MFDEYAKKLKKVQADVPAIFKKVAGKAAIKFVNTAKKLTDDEKLVDTGNYKRNWHAERIEPQVDTYGVLCQNGMKYASWLEYGYTIKKNRFVPFDKMEGTPKTKAFIAKMKAKYPNAKGFMLHAGKVKGKFIGTRAKDEAHFYCLEQLEDELKKAFTSYHRSFVKPEE